MSMQMSDGFFISAGWGIDPTSLLRRINRYRRIPSLGTSLGTPEFERFHTDIIRGQLRAPVVDSRTAVAWGVTASLARLICDSGGGTRRRI